MPSQIAALSPDDYRLRAEAAFTVIERLARSAEVPGWDVSRLKFDHSTFPVMSVGRRWTGLRVRLEAAVVTQPAGGRAPYVFFRAGVTTLRLRGPQSRSLEPLVAHAETHEAPRGIAVKVAQGDLSAWASVEIVPDLDETAITRAFFGVMGAAARYGWAAHGLIGKSMTKEAALAWLSDPAMSGAPFADETALRPG